jgi:hypothetical protein
MPSIIKTSNIMTNQEEIKLVKVLAKQLNAAEWKREEEVGEYVDKMYIDIWKNKSTRGGYNLSAKCMGRMNVKSVKYFEQILKDNNIEGFVYKLGTVGEYLLTKYYPEV